MGTGSNLMVKMTNSCTEMTYPYPKIIKDYSQVLYKCGINTVKTLICTNLENSCKDYITIKDNEWKQFFKSVLEALLKFSC